MAKVLFFTGSQELRGGTERACADLAKGLSNDGYDVSILSQYRGQKSWYDCGSNTKLAQLYNHNKVGVLAKLSIMFYLFVYVRRNKPDILISVESYSFLFVLPLFFLPSRPRIINWEHFNARVDLGRKLRRVARNAASKFADKIVVLSDKDESLWISDFRCEKEKVTRIYNINSIQSGNEGQLACKDDISKHNVVLAAGRLTHQKGFDLLLLAWSHIPNYLRNTWKLRICGSGPDEQKLAQLIARLEISDSVELSGQVDDLTVEYEKAKLFVLSSRFEGFGLVVLEALSSGLPVISFDCPCGPSEIIRHGKDGYLVSPESELALADRIKSLMEDKELLKELTSNTKYPRSKFSSSAIINQWKELVGSFVR